LKVIVQVFACSKRPSSFSIISERTIFIFNTNVLFLVYNICANYSYTALLLFIFKILASNYNIFEIYSKSNQNDNFSEFFFFFWTNYWVTIVFLCILYQTLTTLSFKKSKKYGRASALAVVALYIIEISGFFFDNYNLSQLNSIFYNQNGLLLNNLNKVHPFFLYLSAAMLLKIALIVVKLKPSSLLYLKSYLNKSAYYAKLHLLFASASAIYLGSWWALQEQTWSGWWNWDSSETLSLVIIIYSLYGIHAKHSFIKIQAQTLWNGILLLLSFALYSSVQINFEQTNHNFGLKFSFFFNSFYFLSATSFTLALLCANKNIEAFQTFNFFLHKHRSSGYSKNSTNHKFITTNVLLLLALKILAVSFSMNFGIKLWAIHAINALNGSFCLSIENYFIFYLLLVFLFRLKKKLVSLISTFASAHLIILIFVYIAENNALSELYINARKGVNSSIFCDNFFRQSGLNYFVELNTFEKWENITTRAFDLNSFNINPLFNFFENILYESYFNLNSFLNFFYKNKKIEIFEVTYVSCFFSVSFVWISFLQVMRNRNYYIKYSKSAVSAHF
jgi:cytochrome c biogenesis factor